MTRFQTPKKCEVLCFCSFWGVGCVDRERWPHLHEWNLLFNLSIFLVRFLMLIILIPNVQIFCQNWPQTRFAGLHFFSFSWNLHLGLKLHYEFFQIHIHRRFLLPTLSIHISSHAKRLNKCFCIRNLPIDNKF